MQAFPRHPSRRSRDTYANDGLATKPRPAAEIARPDVAIPPELSLVRTSQAGVWKARSWGVQSICLISAVKDNQHLHANEMFGKAQAAEAHLGEGLLGDEKRHWPLRIEF
jgi:hypothetical protein